MSNNYCSLYTFIKKTNEPLYDILDDICAVGLCRTRSDVTFLNPNKKLTEKLVKMADGDSEQAFYNFKKLFLYGKHDKLTNDHVNYNNKECKNVAGLKKSEKFKPWATNTNVSVFDLSSDEFPEEGKEIEKNLSKRKGKGKRGGELSKKKRIY